MKTLYPMEEIEVFATHLCEGIPAGSTSSVPNFWLFPLTEEREMPGQWLRRKVRERWTPHTHGRVGELLKVCLVAPNGKRAFYLAMRYWQAASHPTRIEL